MTFLISLCKPSENPTFYRRRLNPALITQVMTFPQRNDGSTRTSENRSFSLPRNPFEFVTLNYTDKLQVCGEEFFGCVSFVFFWFDCDGDGCCRQQKGNNDTRQGRLTRLMLLVVTGDGDFFSREGWWCFLRCWQHCVGLGYEFVASMNMFCFAGGGTALCLKCLSPPQKATPQKKFNKCLDFHMKFMVLGRLFPFWVS